MSLERAPLEHDPDATSPWFAPLAVFIALLAHLFEQIAKLKRVRRKGLACDRIRVRYATFSTNTVPAE